jgi:hypothetical protein
MASYVKVPTFVLACGQKKHNLGSDQLKLALSNSAPGGTEAVLADLTEIAYTNLSTRNVTTTSWTQSGGTAKLVCVDLTLTASGGAVAGFRYVWLYNSTATNGELIGYWDRGSTLTLQDGDSCLIDFDGTNGVLQNG